MRDIYKRFPQLKNPFGKHTDFHPNDLLSNTWEMQLPKKRQIGKCSRFSRWHSPDREDWTSEAKTKMIQTWRNTENVSIPQFKLFSEFSKPKKIDSDD